MAKTELMRSASGSKSLSLRSSTQSHDERPKNPEIEDQINELLVEERRLLVAWYLQHRRTGVPDYDEIKSNPFASTLLTRLETSLCKQDVQLDEPYFDYTALRAKQLDEWTHNFLVKHQYEDALVLELSCGLDNRHLRMCSGRDVKWIDVERPRVVALRERLLPRPEGDYTIIAAMLGADDDSWLRGVPADRPVLIIMENVLCYFEPEIGARLVKRLLAHFKKGSIICDTIGSVAVTFTSLVPPLNKGMEHKIPLKWGIDDAKVLLALDRRLVLRDTIYTHNELCEGWFAKGYPPIFGAWTPLISLFPKVSTEVTQSWWPEDHVVVSSTFADSVIVQKGWSISSLRVLRPSLLVVIRGVQALYSIH